jgi:predicted HicB family RNase H-like nuclease
MQRTNIYLTERQQKRLSAEAKRLGISLAELIRRILDQHLSQSVQTKPGF